MDAVIKVGGSLSEKAEILKTLGAEFSEIAKNCQVVFVPGGGGFADVVRKLDKQYNLPVFVSHRLAIMAMDQYGLFLSQIIPDSIICDSLEKATVLSKKGKAVILLPSRLLLKFDPFEASWKVTSDSIAAYITVRLNAPKVILVTDVDGVFSSDPKGSLKSELLSEISLVYFKKIVQPTSVDRFLPLFLAENMIDAYVVNGCFPQRIKDLLSNKMPVCTKIVR